MKGIAVLFMFIIINLSFAINNEEKEAFKLFKKQHKKTYKTEKEEKEREEKFAINYRHIKSHNEKFKKGQSKFELGVNKFADMSVEEFKKSHTGLRIEKRSINNRLPKRTIMKRQTTPGEPVPDQIDWRTLGYVTDVQSQGQCGSCWAFGVVGTIESAYKRDFGKLVNFSEQQLVDCTETAYGCNGGYYTDPIYYLKSSSLRTEEEYPYVAMQGNCQTYGGVPVIKYYYVAYTNNETLLKDLVGYYGPVAIGIEVDYNMQLYRSGIFESYRCTKEVNHGVLIVGYGTENGVDYWIVKNSWGQNHGENGYIRILRDKNICGLPDTVALTSFKYDLPGLCSMLERADSLSYYSDCYIYIP